MRRGKALNLPEGLPARFVNPENGFTLLCNFLDITGRRDQQKIVKIEGVKHAIQSRRVHFRSLPTSKRLQAQITTFYSLPHERRNLWQYYFQNMMRDESREFPPVVSSLEYEALKRYNSHFLHDETNPELIEKSLSDFPGISKSISNSPEWQYPALAIWPELRDDLLRWAVLPSARQDAAALATFAVATILDDVRFLDWAASQSETLKKDYAFALGEKETDARATPVRHEEDNVSNEDETGDVVGRWNEACTAVAEIASKIGNDIPQPEHLDDLIDQVHILEDLREPLAAVLDALRSERLVERVMQAVANIAAEEDASWLTQYAEKIQAQWKLFCIAPGDPDMAQLRQDVEHVERELGDTMSEWQAAEHDMQSAQRQLQELEGSAHEAEDLLDVDDRKVAIHEQITEATRRRRDARLRIFLVIAPGDQRFDPSRDYERECHDASVFGPDRKHEDTIQAPVGSPDREGGVEYAEDAETTTPPPESKDSRKANEKRSGARDDDRPGEEVPDGDSDDDEGIAVEATTSESPDSDTDSRTANLASAGGESRPGQPCKHGDGTLAAEASEEAVVSGPIDESGYRDTAPVAALWQAIDAGRPGIAYHLAKLLTERGEDTETIPPANLIAASALAGHVQSADGEVVNALRPLLESIDPDSLSSNVRQDRDTVNLLLFCATLRPALFAPYYTGATAMLRRIRTPLTPVYQLAKAVADHADRLQGIRLDADLIRTTLRGGWQDEFTTFAARVVDWRNRAESQKIIFDRANRVWHDLFNETGCLAELAALISKDDAAGTGRIEEIRKRIGDQKAFNDLVRLTDRKHKKGSPIQGRALKQLWDHVQPAIDLSSEWLRLMDAKPDSVVFITKRIEELRSDLLPCGREAIAAIEHAAATKMSVATDAALKHARSTIDALLQVFDESATPAAVVSEPPNVIRSRDLLYVTGLDIDIEYCPVARQGGADTLDLLLDRSSHVETLSDAFKARLARGDLIGAELACVGMDAEGDSEVDRCRTSLDREMERERADLKRTHADEESRLEHAFCRGQIDIDGRDELAARLVSLKQWVQPVSSNEQTLDLVSAVAGAKSKLADIRRSIEAEAAERIDAARRRLDTATFANPEPNDRSIVEQIIESGDLLAANELMSRMEKGESVVLPAAADDPFQEFMSLVEGIERELGPSEISQAQLIRQAAARQHIAGVSFQNLSEEEAGYAARLLEAWYTLSRKQRADKQPLQDLLQELGFKVRKLTLLPIRERTRADFEAETIEDRALCPSRQFGSEAKGHYRVLLNWNQSVKDSIAGSPGVTGGTPTLVLHFGCLEGDRENLRKWALQTHRLFLVIDEPLVLFLAARPAGRLSALFRSTLPFTSVVPYATTSSLVPPELFYGRERERQEIADQSGTCFIYGGRQLGKTALLRRVEKDFNRSGQTNVAKWIDLKVNEIGYARGPRDIWPLLQRELAGLGVVQKSRREVDPESRRSVDSLLERIQRWIDARENRRLLLLLDEADAFLEQDGRAEFRESSRLKGLMDRTERRFKVVFAGLHNVLRTIRQANHPLAHLGDPIRVGAMLTNGEWRQAQALVREPLQAAGCRFDGDELSTRILAQTNYYPSLIQLYGAELVRRLRDSRKAFPYAIDDEDISGAYSSRELRSAIRERFLLTLQLDPRYEVIAYTVTLELHGEAELDRGLDPDAIAKAAKAWWPEGFKVTDVEFTMLLHELEGLGVLRSIDGGRRYTLRNPNVLLLLGNNDDIEKTLTKGRQPPMGFEPAAFRARYPKNHQSSKIRGPLTYRQETALRAKGGVAVISGCRAAGLTDVEVFLRQRIEPELFRTLQTASGLDEFERELNDLRLVRNMVTVCHVPLTANWDASWVAAAKRIQRKRAQGRSMRSKVVFTATPELLWRILVGGPEWEGMERIEIGPWDEKFLRHWLEDINFTADADHVNELMETSGGWPATLDKFSEKQPRRTWSTRIEELDHELAKAHDMQDFGIHSKEVERILRTLLNEDTFDTESIEIASEELEMEHSEIERRVKWSECLGLISGDGNGRWTFNPLIRRLLEAHNPE